MQNADTVHRQGLCVRSNCVKVRFFAGDHAEWILAQCWCSNTVGDNSHHVMLSLSRPPQPRVKRRTSRLRSCLQLVNIQLRSDSSGAIGMASKRGLQRLRHLDARFLWLEAETAAQRVRISKVAGPELLTAHPATVS